MRERLKWEPNPNRLGSWTATTINGAVLKVEEQIRGPYRRSGKRRYRVVVNGETISTFIEDLDDAKREAVLAALEVEG